MITARTALINALGAVAKTLGTPVSTQPATAQGVYNNTVDTSAVKVLSASGNGRNRFIRITLPTANRWLAWTTVANGATAPTLTAVGDGTATDGALIGGTSAGQHAEFSIPDTQDLYLAGDAADTPYNLVVIDGV